MRIVGAALGAVAGGLAAIGYGIPSFGVGVAALVGLGLGSLAVRTWTELD